MHIPCVNIHKMMFGLFVCIPFDDYPFHCLYSDWCVFLFGFGWVFLLFVWSVCLYSDRSTTALLFLRMSVFGMTMAHFFISILIDDCCFVCFILFYLFSYCFWGPADHEGQIRTTLLFVSMSVFWLTIAHLFVCFVCILINECSSLYSYYSDSLSRRFGSRHRRDVLLTATDATFW